MVRLIIEGILHVVIVYSIFHFIRLLNELTYESGANNHDEL